MAVIHIRKDRTKALEVDGDNDRYVLHQGVRFTVTNHAIVEDFTSSGNIYEINGLLRGDAAMELDGNNTTVIVGATGRIRGGDGLELEDNATVVNRGSIVIEENGLQAGINLKLDNYGLLEAEYPIEMESGVVHNHASGRIIGESFTIKGGLDTTRIVNDGLISGGALAYDGLNGRDVIVNRGRISGAVELDGGNDLFDNRGGICGGTLLGGAGDDVLVTDDRETFMIELDGEGNDTVRSTVSYKISGSVEQLMLIGDRNAKAEGNELINGIVGNTGDNRLFGYGSNDFLDGGAGDDQLSGGGDAGTEDTFIFGTGYDRDTILDFQDNVDKLSLSGFDAASDFTDLYNNHSRENSDGDLVIFANGDRLTILGMTRAQLDSGDMFFD